MAPRKETLISSSLRKGLETIPVRPLSVGHLVTLQHFRNSSFQSVVNKAPQVQGLFMERQSYQGNSPEGEI